MIVKFYDSQFHVCCEILLYINFQLMFFPCCFKQTSCFNVKNHVLAENANGDIFTNMWSVKLNLRHSSHALGLHFKASQIAKSIGMNNLGQVGELIGHYVFVSNETQKIKNSFPNHSDILWYAQQKVLKRDKRKPIKQKPESEKVFQQPEINDPWYFKQWHLHNTRGPIDCNVSGVWKNGITGKGVVVAVVDDGVEWQHPDLRDNYCPEGSFDLNSDDSDPTPEPDEKDENKHGTRCAGEIAAVANDVCGIGIAYRAKFSGIRILDGPMTDSIEAIAFNKHMNINDIYSCSWGPEDDGQTVDGPRALAQAALQHGVVAGRSGFGSIYIVASGNGGSHGDNCNYDGYANSIYTITIAAVDEFGLHPTYAESCSSMLACTVSSGNSPARSITTTDWTLGKNDKGCTDDHTGTSAATPLVAGMVALMLEARPCLTWRDVQYIIVMTAIPLYEINKNHGRKAWKTNAANFSHSDSHGFGLLNSWRLVNAAKIWKPLPWLTSLKPSCFLPRNNNIPKGSSEPLVVEAIVSKQDCNKHLLRTLEQIIITVSITHPSRGKLRFVFICPSGTRTTIPPRRKDMSGEGLSDWSFSTVRCWGEKPFGKYQFKMFDVDKNGKSEKPGVLKMWKITLYGSQLTSNDIYLRKRSVHKSLSGEHLSANSNFSLPCPKGQPLTFDVTEALSKRTLKLVIMLSCLCAFCGFYYTVEMAWCNEEEKTTENTSEAVEVSLQNETVHESGGTVEEYDNIHSVATTVASTADIPMLQLSHELVEDTDTNDRCSVMNEASNCQQASL